MVLITPLRVEAILSLAVLLRGEYDHTSVAVDDRSAVATVLLLHHQREHLAHRFGEPRRTDLSSPAPAQDFALGRRLVRGGLTTTSSNWSMLMDEQLHFISRRHSVVAGQKTHTRTSTRRLRPVGESISDNVFYTNLNTSLGIRTSAKIKKNAQESLTRGAPSWRAPSCSPVPAVFAPIRRWASKWAPKSRNTPKSR